jgi:hypothetical protein
MKFREVRAIRIPSGTAKKIRYNGKTLWEPAPFRYVSLGDSIAAGHSLDGWSYDTQYGKNGNTETVIVPGCYTDLISGAEVCVRDGKLKTNGKPLIFKVK